MQMYVHRFVERVCVYVIMEHSVVQRQWLRHLLEPFVMLLQLVKGLGFVCFA